MKDDERIIKQDNHNLFYKEEPLFAEEINSMIFDLTKECSLRMPFEFDKNGTDADFYFFGEKIALFIKNNKLESIVTIMEDFENAPYLCLAYTKPEGRGCGANKKLLSLLKDYFTEKGFKTFALSSDATNVNSLTPSLLKAGFKIKKTSYRKDL